MDDVRRPSAALQPRLGLAPATLQMCLRFANEVLDQAGIDGFDVEARLLCEWVAKRSRTQFVTNSHEIMAPETVILLESALEKRISGMPVHRIMGFREFYGLNLTLSSATLEPRPDTETLVNQVIDIVEKNSLLGSHLKVLDLGTGTGAIALALLSKIPNSEAVAVDVSVQALETAQQNAQENGFSSRFQTLHSNWFERVVGKFDIIVSNPPYIRTDIINQLQVEVREHDPLIALDGGPDGLAPYREIAQKSASFLKQNGVVCVEIGYDQAIDIQTIFGSYGYDLCELRKDLGGRDRALAFTINQG